MHGTGTARFVAPPRRQAGVTGRGGGGPARRRRAGALRWRVASRRIASARRVTEPVTPP